jgi:catechol 2,3-dioxygenase-like lactoylglutathione lyase family enzyme
MDGGLTLAGIELIVDDLDRAIELFRDVLGFEVLSRGPSALVAGETAAIDLDSIVLNLLAPAATGEGTILAERTARLSQLIAVEREERAGELRRDAALERGLAVAPLDDSSFYVTPESVAGALGQAVAVVVTRRPAT